MLAPRNGAILALRLSMQNKSGIFTGFVEAPSSVVWVSLTKRLAGRAWGLKLRLTAVR